MLKFNVIPCAIAVACGLFALGAVAGGASDCRPETWFHIIGGNATKEGLSADMEALRDAGFGGIQFFHGQFGKAEAWDGVPVQIPCLSAKWDDLVAHLAGECERLGLSFKIQNCPGWSMSGGPWIAPSNAMRKLVHARRDVRGEVPPVPVPEEFRDADSDWRDIAYVAFPTPLGDDERGGTLEPQSVETNGNVRLFHFENPTAIRTLELPSPSDLNHAWSYNPDTHVLLEAQTKSGWKAVCDVDYPQGCWQDKVPFSIACEVFPSTTWRLTMTSPHPFKLPFARLRSAARLDNWEGLSALVLRGQLKRPAPRQDEAAYLPSGTVRVVKPGEALPCGGWTVLRVGHVNMKKKNGPAPKEATGWECDKLDPRGIEANFDGYIGRLLKGPLKGRNLRGIVVDSWECERQTWTWRMAEWFREANGYDVGPFMPALFGWVVGSPAETERFLLDWRRTVSGLVTRNYYGRMSELAHENGLSAAYETAFGDVIPGDILEYWKYCDTPMCEFWQPYTPEGGYVGHPNFKSVRPCVSAAHVYGKRRVDCEAFTNVALTWDESFRALKEQAVRHFARGVTHLVFHTCTHNPQIDGRRPGTSFGGFIGTPFVRGQTWWSFMRPFTDWAAECCAFLERGLPVVDVLRYLGDELDHKPDELEYFPEGFKNDYFNADILFNRLDVKDGCFVLSDGMSYSAIWVPPSVVVAPKTRARLDELAAKGGRVVYGTADEAVAGMKPQISVGRVVPNAPGGGVGTRRPTSASLLWYHRKDGDADLFFVAANEKGFKGEVTFSTQRGEKTLSLDLAPFENRLLEFSADVVPSISSVPSIPSVSLDSWTLSFPSSWGAPDRMKLDRLVPWKHLPGVSEEGRAFSGTATYTTNVELKKSSVVLDLGEVRDFARVYVNGREVAALWAEPYRCDITPYVKEGENEIRVEVTSTWFNRLVYDFSQPPEKRKTWTIWTAKNVPCLKPNAGLRTSGLMGPVRLKGATVCRCF